MAAPIINLHFVRALTILYRTEQYCAMARQIEFDRSLARDKALVLFWRKGYQATSLADLLAAMEIGRSSFYAAFGDKRTLFLECLDLFAARTGAAVQRTRAALPPIDALQDFFERNFVGTRVVKGKLGCMLVNTILEMAGVDDALSARASQHLAAFQAMFEDFLVEAGHEPLRARELAALLMVLNEGIRVSSRRDLPPEEQLMPIQATFRLIRNATN